MNRTRKKRLAIVGWIVLCGTAWPGETPPPPDSAPAIVARIVGSGDLLKGEVGWRPGHGDDRTEIGGYGNWISEVTPSQVEAYGGGIYGTFDAIKDAPFSPLSGMTTDKILSSLYVGVLLGALKPRTTSWDTTAALMTGLSFGDKRGGVRLGVRYEYFLTRDLWKALADVPSTSRVMATLEYRFGRSGK